MRTATPTLARRDLLRAAGLRHLTEEKGHCLLQWMGNNIHAVCTAYISNCSPDLSALHRPTGMQLVQLKQVISTDKCRYCLCCFCSSSRDNSIAEIELHFSSVSNDNSKSVRQHYVSM